MDSLMDHQSQFIFLFASLSQSYDKVTFMKALQTLIVSIKTTIIKETRGQMQQTYFAILTSLFKLIPYTRDIYGGLGERELTYIMLFIWNYQFPVPTAHCIRKMILPHEDTLDPPFGSWRDIKYICATVKKYSEKGENDPFIETCIAMMNHQLDDDTKKWEDALDHFIQKQSSASINVPTKPTPSSAGISLVCKWIPREHSAFDWLFKRCMIQWIRNFHPHIFQSCKSDSQFNRAMKKGSKIYRRIFSRLSKEWETLEFKQCNHSWDTISIENIPMTAALTQQNALSNIGLNGQARIKTTNHPHRNKCAKNVGIHHSTNHAYKKHHIDKANPVFIDMGWIIQSALRVHNNEQMVRLENLWLRLLSQLSISDDSSTHDCGLSGFLPIVDMSMFYHDPKRFYEALGHACLIALAPKSSNSILLFDTTIHYIQFNSCSRSLQSIINVLKPIYHQHHIGQDFLGVCDAIVQAIQSSQISYSLVASMKLCFFVHIPFHEVPHVCNLVSTYFKKYEISAIPRCLFWLSGSAGSDISRNIYPIIENDSPTNKPSVSADPDPDLITPLYISGSSNYIWTRISHISSSVWPLVHPFDFVLYLLNQPRYDIFQEYFSTLFTPAVTVT